MENRNSNLTSDFKPDFQLALRVEEEKSLKKKLNLLSNALALSSFNSEQVLEILEKICLKSANKIGRNKQLLEQFNTIYTNALNNIVDGLNGYLGDLFKKIPLKEINLIIVDKVKDKEGETTKPNPDRPNLNNYQQSFNDLANLIITKILLSDSKEEALAKCERFGRIAIVCAMQNNFYGLFIIAAALNHASIQKLTENAPLSDYYKNKFANLLPDLRANKYKKMFERQEDASRNSIPYLGSYSSIITPANEAVIAAKDKIKEIELKLIELVRERLLFLIPNPNLLNENQKSQIEELINITTKATKNLKEGTADFTTLELLRATLNVMTQIASKSQESSSLSEAESRDINLLLVILKELTTKYSYKAFSSAERLANEKKLGHYLDELKNIPGIFPLVNLYLFQARKVFADDFIFAQENMDKFIQRAKMVRKNFKKKPNPPLAKTWMGSNYLMLQNLNVIQHNYNAKQQPENKLKPINMENFTDNFDNFTNEIVKNLVVPKSGTATKKSDENKSQNISNQYNEMLKVLDTQTPTLERLLSPKDFLKNSIDQLTIQYNNFIKEMRKEKLNPNYESQQREHIRKNYADSAYKIENILNSYYYKQPNASETRSNEDKIDKLEELVKDLNRIITLKNKDADKKFQSELIKLQRAISKDTLINKVSTFFEFENPDAQDINKRIKRTISGQINYLEKWLMSEDIQKDKAISEAITVLKDAITIYSVINNLITILNQTELTYSQKLLYFEFAMKNLSKEKNHPLIEILLPTLEAMGKNLQAFAKTEIKTAQDNMTQNQEKFNTMSQSTFDKLSKLEGDKTLKHRHSVRNLTLNFKATFTRKPSQINLGNTSKTLAKATSTRTLNRVPSKVLLRGSLSPDLPKEKVISKPRGSLPVGVESPITAMDDVKEGKQIQDLRNRKNSISLNKEFLTSLDLKSKRPQSSSSSESVSFETPDQHKKVAESKSETSSEEDKAIKTSKLDNVLIKKKGILKNKSESSDSEKTSFEASSSDSEKTQLEALNRNAEKPKLVETKSYIAISSDAEKAKAKGKVRFGLESVELKRPQEMDSISRRPSVASESETSLFGSRFKKESKDKEQMKEVLNPLRQIIEEKKLEKSQTARSSSPRPSSPNLEKTKSSIFVGHNLQKNPSSKPEEKKLAKSNSSRVSDNSIETKVNPLFGKTLPEKKSSTAQSNQTNTSPSEKKPTNLKK